MITFSVSGLTISMSKVMEGLCGVDLWSPDGWYLANNVNDNVLSVWPNHISDKVPVLYTLTHHQTAVKVITMSCVGASVW